MTESANAIAAKSTTKRRTLPRRTLNPLCTRRDERGTFGATDVRDDLQRVTGSYRDLLAFPLSISMTS
jgi:hypothetical protein